jgi:MoaA/NifB/PqqE/SkfB family radical SAM enzyme
MPGALPGYLPEKFKRIHVELTNRCNFRCSFCPDAVMTRSRGDMDPEVAKSALDQIAQLDIAQKVTFHVMGEPLLHPRFFHILDHADSKGLKVGLTTNGALLRPDTIDELARRDLHQIDISLQCPDEKSFHATRGTRIDFNKYTENLLDLVAACWQREEPPIFKIRIMVTKFSANMRNRLGIPDFLGSTTQLRSTLTQWATLIYDRIGVTGREREKALNGVNRLSIYGWNVIEIHPGLFIETYVLTDWGNAFAPEAIYEVDKGYCFGMRDHFAILYNGDVVLCCVDYDGKTAIGNIRDQSLESILNGSELARIMEGFRTNRLVSPYCKRCLGSSTRLGAYLKPTLSLLGLKMLKPILYRHYRLYE